MGYPVPVGEAWGPNDPVGPLRQVSADRSQAIADGLNVYVGGDHD